MHLDNLIEDIGSFGKFQITMIIVVMTPKLGIGYNMMIMAYGSLVPDWWCVKQGESIFNLTSGNSSYQHCEATSQSNSSCHRVYDPTITTVVSEWDLVCERKWITPSISSIQMGGVLLGALIGGQCAETFGRKKTYYSTLLSQAVFTILIIFTDSWYTYTFMRFLIGVTLGSYLVVCVFLVEFINYKYRPVLTAVPFWATGICFLSLSTWLLRNWQYVHVVVGVFTLPFLLGWFIVPESVRWLAVKGRIQEAELVVERIAKWNGRVKPPNTTSILQAVKDEELRNQGGKQYTYLDLYRYSFAKHTILVHIVWWCISTSYYGFSFGVGKFTGDYYLNQFFMYILEFPLFLPTIILMNKYGRRALSVVNFVAGAACCILVIIIQNTVFSNERGTIITILSLASKLFASQAWAAFIVLTNESYPTVVRNLGYGAANTAARIGGIAAPFIFSLTDNKMVPYIVTTFLLGGSAILTFFFLPETLGTALEDIIGRKEIEEAKFNNEIDDNNETVSCLVKDKTTSSV